MATCIWISTSSTDYATNANWSNGTAPTTGDDVIFSDIGTANVTTNLDQSAVAIGSFTVLQSYTGQLGTTSAFLQVKTPVASIGDFTGNGSPTGSNRLNIDFGSATAVTCTIHNSAGSAADTTRMPIRIKAANASSIFYTRGGLVEFANQPGETSTIGTIDVKNANPAASNCTVSIGSGVTLTTVTVDGGIVYLNCGATTFNANGGQCVTSGSGAFTTINNRGCILTSNSSGTIATLNANGGTTDFSQSDAARTVTTVAATVNPSAKIIGYGAVVTFTNKLPVPGNGTGWTVQIGTN